MRYSCEEASIGWLRVHWDKLRLHAYTVRRNGKVARFFC